MDQFQNIPGVGHRAEGPAGNELVGDDIFGYFSAINLEAIKNHDLCFTICFKKEIDYTRIDQGGQNENQSLILISKDHKSYDMWTDGINFLLGNSMDNDNQKDNRSTRFKEDLDFLLLQTQMRMSLLNPCDTNNFKTLPKVPPPPPNYRFARYKFCPDKKTIEGPFCKVPNDNKSNAVA